MVDPDFAPLLREMWPEIERCMKNAKTIPALRPIAEQLLDDYFGLLDTLMGATK